MSDTRLIHITVDVMVEVPLGKATTMFRQATEAVTTLINGKRLDNVVSVDIIDPDYSDIQRPDLPSVGEEDQPRVGDHVYVDPDKDEEQPATWPVIDLMLGEEGDGIWRIHVRDFEGGDEFCVAWNPNGYWASI